MRPLVRGKRIFRGAAILGLAQSNEFVAIGVTRPSSLIQYLTLDSRQIHHIGFDERLHEFGAPIEFRSKVPEDRDDVDVLSSILGVVGTYDL